MRGQFVFPYPNIDVNETFKIFIDGFSAIPTERHMFISKYFLNSENTPVEHRYLLDHPIYLIEHIMWAKDDEGIYFIALLAVYEEEDDNSIFYNPWTLN